ncbi:MAG: glycerol-3-phosphate dehydrogenase/oxidase, partial [Candidatus Obscuribacterales bacterium]|nr:glycerol-3-phosphate dehydrogenase/oxidase [Candidatus Obscuribacterales bacterium]
SSDLYKGDFFKNLKLRAGLCLYDLMAGFGNKLRHRTVSAAELLSRCPGLKREGLKGGLLYYDCQTDDARHTLELVLAASAQGAQVCNYVKLESTLKDSRGVIYAARLKDVLNGKEAVIYVKQVINAGGVWSESVSKAADSEFKGKLVPSKGIHVTVPRSKLPIEAALIIPSVHDSRFLFAVPWQGSVIIGTTDTEYDGNLENPGVDNSEKQYLLDAVNSMFPGRQVVLSDLRASFAGLRPLIKESHAGSTADLSRKHRLERSKQGVISIAGGKLTTYRLMAKETVDFALKSMRRNGELLELPSSSTHELRLGAFAKGENAQELLKQIARRFMRLGIKAESARYLAQTYAKRSSEILRLIKEDASLAQPLLPEHPYIAAQVLHALRFEGAVRLSDVLSRRIRLSFLDAEAAWQLAEKVYDLMAPELGWQLLSKEEILQHFKKELFAGQAETKSALEVENG